MALLHDGSAFKAKSSTSNAWDCEAIPEPIAYIRLTRLSGLIYVPV
jgi:hypothetical protein